MIYLIAAEALFGSEGFGYRINWNRGNGENGCRVVYLAILVPRLLDNWILRRAGAGWSLVRRLNDGRIHKR